MLAARGTVMALVALSCALAVGGCGGGFDSSTSGERLIRNFYERFGQGRVAVRSVTCPGGIRQKVGTTYACKVVLRDTAAGVDHKGTITIHVAAGNKVQLRPAQDIHVQ
jgi:hypothetical protein